MAGDFGAEERRLLEEQASSLYELAARKGPISRGNPVIAVDSDQRPAFDLLVDLGLLILEPDSGYVAVDPSTVQSRIVTPMGQQAAALLEESSRWAATFASLGQAFRRSEYDRSTITEVHGYANINRFVQAAVSDAQTELLTAQPSGARSAATLAVAAKRDIRALKRGVAMRTLYQHSARRSQPTRAYVADVAEYGAEVRTLDEFFKRLIVVDRELAIVPGVAGNHVAIAITEPSLIAYLADVFDRYWERALGFLDRELRSVDIAGDVRDMTVRMLVEGHSDTVSAKRMGVSTRTYAGYVADIKDEYAVQTRFQLGHALGKEEVRKRTRRKRPGKDQG